MIKCNFNSNIILNITGVLIFISSFIILTYIPIKLFYLHGYTFTLIVLQLYWDNIAPGLYGILIFFEIYFAAFNGNKIIRIRYTLMVLIIQSICLIISHMSHIGNEYFKVFWPVKVAYVLILLSGISIYIIIINKTTIGILILSSIISIFIMMFTQTYLGYIHLTGGRIINPILCFGISLGILFEYIENIKCTCFIQKHKHNK